MSNEQDTVYLNQALRLNFTIRDKDRKIVDVSASAPTIRITRRGRVVLSGSTVNETTGTDGKVYYDIAENVLAYAGTWEVQVSYTDGTKVYPTTIVTFQVSQKV